MLFKSDVVLAPRTIAVRVVVDPARTLINSLALLSMTETRSGLGDWIVQTAAAMPPETRRDNEIAGQLFDVIEFDDDPMEFPALIKRIEQQDMGHAIQKLVRHIAEKDDIDADQILRSKEEYVDLINSFFVNKGEECNRELIAAAYDYMVDPEAARRFLVEHLKTMWSKYLETEWNRVRPVLYETAAVFDQLDLSDLTPLEAIQAVTGRDMTAFWKDDETEELIFVPSTHTGPYMSQWGMDEKRRTFIIYGARVPEGVETTSSELSLRDLLVQFTALADDSRLHILSLLTNHRELSSQDFQQMLDLSQSAASRHLRQLVATGYLNERRRELNKVFSLNPQRIQETAAAMRILLSRK
jgi:ArsR family transcriptional regulator, lead/cadmium/zinc/bismuth-responsive transcriptional repressor